MKKIAKVLMLTVVLTIGAATVVSAQVPPPTPPTIWGRFTKAIRGAEDWVIKVTRNWPRMQ